MLNRRAEGDAFAVTLRTHVSEIFGFAGVDHHVGGTGVFTHNHARIDIFLRSDEEGAAFLQIIEGVGHGGPRFEGDEYTVDPGRNFATERTVLTEEMGNDSHAFGKILEIGLKANQATGGNGRDERGVFAVRFHVLDLGFASRKITHDITQGERRDFRVKGFDRFENGTVLGLLENNFRAGDEDFESLATHLFEENGDLHFATSTNFKTTRGASVDKA